MDQWVEGAEARIFERARRERNPLIAAREKNMSRHPSAPTRRKVQTSAAAGAVGCSAGRPGPSHQRDELAGPPPGSEEPRLRLLDLHTLAANARNASSTSTRQRT